MGLAPCICKCRVIADDHGFLSKELKEGRMMLDSGGWNARACPTLGTPGMGLATRQVEYDDACSFFARACENVRLRLTFSLAGHGVVRASDV